MLFISVRRGLVGEPGPYREGPENKEMEAPPNPYTLTQDKAFSLGLTVVAFTNEQATALVAALDRYAAKREGLYPVDFLLIERITDRLRKSIAFPGPERSDPSQSIVVFADEESDWLLEVLEDIPDGQRSGLLFEAQHAIEQAVEQSV